MRVLTAVVLSLPLIGAYAIFAIGIVMIYRASKVLNLAHGAMAMVPAYLIYTLVQSKVPVLVAFPVALAAGAGLGLAIERFFVRRLRSQSETAQTVGTVAALGLLLALAAKVWGTTPKEAVRIFPKGFISIGSSGIQVGEIGLFVVMAVVAFGLYFLLQKTDLGLMMRGTAESRLAASLHGVNPDRITELTWAIGGGLAALAGVLLAAVTNLNPYVLTLQALPGFIAALLGGLGSLPGAVAGAAVVGITQSLIPLLATLGKTQGAPQLLLAILAMAVMAYRGKSIVGVSDVREGISSTQSASSDEGVKGLPKGRRLGPTVVTLAVLAAVVFPLVAPFSVLGAANLAAPYSLVAISIVILTGWVGQISLGHAALVGVSAYVTGWAAGTLGVPFPLSIVPAALAAAGAALLLGAVALRVRGLYLAVATLVFSWMASEFLFRQIWVTKNDQVPIKVIGDRGVFPTFDFTDRRVFYFLAWAFVVLCAYAAMNLRDSKVGRAFFAVRGSEMAAASLGIDVMRTKLIAFAVSGAIAGAAGNLVMSGSRVVNPDQFTFNVSLFFLAVAVVGGLNSLGGAIGSGLLFAGLTEVFFRVRFLGGLLEIVSALLLTFVLLTYPGGLASLPKDLARRAAAIRMGRARIKTTTGLKEKTAPAVSSLPPKRIFRILGRPKFRLPAAPRMRLPKLHMPRIGRAGGVRAAPPVNFRSAVEALDTPVSDASPNGRGAAPGAPEDLAAKLLTLKDRIALAAPDEHQQRQARRPLLEAEGVTVQFGGLVAVNNASLTVREGEIAGLIGPNGAGKTTLFNAIAGFNAPSKGTIRMYGQDVTSLSIHERARIGVARTFQLIQLFGSLTVFENLLVATHAFNPTGVFANISGTERAIASEKEARARVKEVLELLELDGVSNRRAADLPFGVLRMVEVARALVTGFRVTMLDEPASGLDNNETDRLMDVLRFVRGLGVTLLLIEHDVRMVTGVSDYMYVLDQGAMIAEGTAEEIQRDPKVIAAYLGEPAGEKELVS